MADDLQRLEEKVDKILDRVGSIDVTLASQHVSLKEHMRRTKILEETIKPIKLHVDRIQGVIKLIGLIAAGAAIAESVLYVVEHVKDLIK